MMCYYLNVQFQGQMVNVSVIDVITVIIIIIIIITSAFQP